MISVCYPWKMDVDIEKTNQFYQENDYSVNKEWNKAFINRLSTIQREFFDKLNIDLMKIEIEKSDFLDNEEVPYIFVINFLICGKFLSMPKEQLEIYVDEEVFGESVDTNAIESILTEELLTYDGLELGTGIRFKHPATHFEENQFQKWNCGFICGALIVRSQ